MSVATKLIVQGRVIQTTSRTIQPKAPGSSPITFRDMLVVGDNCLANVGLPDDVDTPKEGTVIHALVEVGTYRDDDTTRLVKFLA